MGNVASPSNLRVQIRQLCCLGFSGQQLVPSLLKSLRRLIGADSAAFFWVDVSGHMTDLYAERVLPSPATRLYFERYYDADGSSFRDSLVRRLRSREDVCVVTPSREHERSEFYNDIYRPLGAHHVMYGIVREQARAIGQLSLYRPKAAQPFSSPERAELASVMRYLAHGLSGAPLRNDTATRFIDSGDDAVILIDGRGEIHTMSAAARRLLALATQAGVRRRDVGDNATAGRSMLHELVGRLRSSLDVDDARPPCVSVVNAWGRFVLRAYFTADEAGAGERALFAIRIARQEPLLLRFVTALDRLELSPQQREVAVGLADGLSNPELAARMGITVNTVASHVKQLFEKLDIHERSDVVTTVLGAG